MSRTSERRTPSSPADVVQFSLRRTTTSTISVDHEDRTERRTAHVWGHTDAAQKDPLPEQDYEKEDRSFEDFRPADPIVRLSSSARGPEPGRVSASARTSGATASTDRSISASNKNEFGTLRSTYGNASPVGEVLDAEWNGSPAFDQQIHFGSRWQDWATPPVSEGRHSGSQGPMPSVLASQGHGSIGQASQDESTGKNSGGHNSMDSSVESYHTTLRKLNRCSSGTRSSVALWLKGQKRYKPDPKMGEPESKQPKISPWEPRSPPPIPNRISTFQPAEQYKQLDTRSHTSQVNEQLRDKEKRRVSIAPGAESQSPSQKEHKRGFLGPLRSSYKNSPNNQPKHLEKQRDGGERRASSYSYGSGKSGRDEEPFGQASPLGFSLNKTPRRVGRTGHFTRSQRSSEGEDDAPVKGPYVGSSRRTGELESPPTNIGELKPPEMRLTEQDGWLKPRRPRVDRSSSSAYSPCDTSARAMESPAAYSAWRTHLADKDSPRFRFNDNPQRGPPGPSNNPPLEFTDVPLEFNEPSQVPRLAQASPTRLRSIPGVLPSEANRVPTPPMPRDLPKAKRKYLWDSWYPRTFDKDSEKASTRGSERTSNASDHWQTPFPMPKEAHISKTIAKDSETGQRDCFRIRMDAALGEEDKPQGIEDLRMFAWDIPEHLSSSPLCPLHPKHSSGGKGACVYHGRSSKAVRKDKMADTISPSDLGVDGWA